MENIRLLGPEIWLSGFALLLMLADLWIKPRHGETLYLLGILSAAITLGMLGLAYSNPAHYQGSGTLWVVDPLALFFKALVLAATILVLLLTLDYRRNDRHHLGTFSALVLFASAGLMTLVSAADFLLIFLSLELVSLSSFILVGFERADRKSSEGGIKYYLIGAFSSALMLYGISLYYGATGTTRLVSSALPGVPPAMFVMACLLILVGFGFKISMAPFHLWVPDAYEGAPTPVTAYLSIAPKIAALALMARVFTEAIPLSSLQLSQLLSFLAMLTMTVGNLTAIFQSNVKRLLAYSSIAQAGYMLIGIVTADTLGREGLLLYSLVYLFMNIGAFAVAIVVGNDSGYELSDYAGLSRRNFGLALLMAFFLLSLAGIPPLAGFIAKFYLFAAAVKGGLYWLAVVGVVNSVISVYYYLRIAYQMFFMAPRRPEPMRLGIYAYSGLVVAAVGVFAIGLYPEPLLVTVRLSAEFLSLAAP